MTGVSIIICTHNRVQIIDECLGAIVHQTVDGVEVEIIVVLNNCTDDTEQEVAKFQKDFPHIKWVNEPNEGLSIARNRGIKEAQFDWVCFLDDDAKAWPDFLARLVWNIQRNDFDAFGGMFYPWYVHSKPNWLPEHIGTMHKLVEVRGLVPAGRYIAGGICAYKKSIVIEAGGFPEGIGMRGKKIGFGEENVLQDKLMAKGARIGFDPNWAIDHLVPAYKMYLSWHLHRAFAKGRDAKLSGKKMGKLKVVLTFLKILIMPFYLGLKNIPRLILGRNYYWQNYLLDCSFYSLKNWGQLFGK